MSRAGARNGASCFPSLFSLFAPVKSCLSSVGSGEDQAVNAVTQFHLMEIDEQPKRDIQQFHVTQELRLVDRQHLLHGLASTSTHPSTSISNRSGSSRVKPLYSIITSFWLTLVSPRSSNSFVRHHS